MLQRTWTLIKQTFTYWSEDNVSRLAAALAYYMVFSLTPLLIICIAIVGFAWGKEAAQGQIIQHIGGLVGIESAHEIQLMIERANRPATGIFATVFGLATVLLGAYWVFGELQDGLNTIWGVKSKPDRGILESLKDRFLPFTIVLGVGFLLLVSLSLSVLLTALSHYLDTLIPEISIVWFGVDFIGSLAVITILFAMIFKILPNVQLNWSDVWIGAFATALLFTIGKFLLGIYLGISGVASAYGAAGSLIVILIWVYYSAQILYLGAEFTKVFTKRKGAFITPSQNAVLIREQFPKNKS